MKASRRSWQYYRDEPNSAIVNSESFKSKEKLTGEIPADANAKDVKNTIK